MGLGLGVGCMSRVTEGNGGEEPFTLLILLDITFYTFPLPFLGDHLAAAGHSPGQVAQMFASFTYTGLAAGLVVLVRELRRTVGQVEYRIDVSA